MVIFQDTVMRSQKEQVWYHVDVNSAYLSWTAAYRVCILGEDLDLRDLPSVIGGSEAERHGIVLAKSSSAKGYVCPDRKRTG